MYVWGSLFLLLSILTISSNMGTTDFDALFKTNFYNSIQFFIFCGIFIAFAVKTPVKWFGKSLLRDKLSNSGDTLKLLESNNNGKIVCGWVNYSCMVIYQKIFEKKDGWSRI